METERILLRNWHEKDVEELFRYASNPALGGAAGWEPHRSLEQSRQLLPTVFGNPETYAIVLKATGLPVGNIEIMGQDDFHTAPLAPNEAELSYWIGQEFWGQGLVPEATRLILRRCFEELELDGVWCCHYEGNLQSKRVQEKTGFIFHHCEKNARTKTGETRVVNLLHMTYHQWVAAK
ncbi:MAG: GNAT family N-acetyltransferase [Spirochaetaceae bacterium]|nr:GNAT family N-acetyltransferase [Spirochaetaceae bacterium]